MKKIIILVLLLILLGGLALKFLPTKHASRKPAHSGEEAWSFKEGRGVTLNEAATKSLGISVAEVQSANITPEREAVTVQIYEDASESAAKDHNAMGSLFLPSEEAKKLVPGQPFELRGNGVLFGAAVVSVKPPSEGNGGLAEVLAYLSDPKAELHIGDFLEARLAQTKGARSGVTAIPQSSVVDSVRGPFVYVANNKSFLRTPVKLGAAQKGVVEVVDGLFEGDAIVTQGAPALWMVELQAVNGGKGCGDAH